MNHAAHSLAELLPSMSDSDYRLLKESIERDGLKMPIVLHEGCILDGRHRYRACMELGVSPTFQELPSGENPAAFVFAANVARRELTLGDKLALAEKFLPRIQEAAAARKKAGTLASQDAKGKTAAELAKLVGASTASVERHLLVKRAIEVLLEAGRTEEADRLGRAAAQNLAGAAMEARVILNPPSEAELRAALERLATVFGKAAADRFAKKLPGREIIFWSEQSEEVIAMIGRLAEQDWKPTEVVEMLGTPIQAKMRFKHLFPRATAAGGKFICELEGWEIKVFRSS